MRMHKSPKESIIRAYNELRIERGAKPIGERVFVRETGFSPFYWKGGYWRSWSAFQAAAGHVPNSQTERIAHEMLLRRFAELALERNGIPTQADLTLKKKEDPSFPGKAPFGGLAREQHSWRRLPSIARVEKNLHWYVISSRRASQEDSVIDWSHSASRASSIYFDQAGTTSSVEPTQWGAVFVN